METSQTKAAPSHAVADATSTVLAPASFRL
jgi:hypothetical protein